MTPFSLSAYFVLMTAAIQSDTGPVLPIQGPPPRATIPAAEREALGLDARSWAGGKVQPEVSRSFQQGSAAHVPFWFEGRVYVQVQLRHEPQGAADSPANISAIRQRQSTVLRNVTAADFAVMYCFRTHPGVLGYVTRAGVDRLASHVDVVAIRLDDKPYPRLPERITADQLPPPTSAPSREHPKVHEAVFRALELEERVFVRVSLAFDKSRPLTSDEVTTIDNRVLAVLTADEFWMVNRKVIIPSVAGYITRDGLNKLLDHPDVVRISLDGRVRLPSGAR